MLKDTAYSRLIAIARKLDYADNLRVAWDWESGKGYRRAYRYGCCGYMDKRVLIHQDGNSNWCLIGCNYGH